MKIHLVYYIDDDLDRTVNIVSIFSELKLANDFIETRAEWNRRECYVETQEGYLLAISEQRRLTSS